LYSAIKSSGAALKSRNEIVSAARRSIVALAWLLVSVRAGNMALSLGCIDAAYQGGLIDVATAVHAVSDEGFTGASALICRDSTMCYSISAIEQLLDTCHYRQRCQAMNTIRSLRRERGWTQFDLALAVGVQPQTIYLWEKGQRLPRVPQLRRLGQIFEVCSDDIALVPLVNDSTPPTRQVRVGLRPSEQMPDGGPIGRAPGHSRETADDGRDDS
jgi:DNA-binding XRE family transcriptional regulator